MTIRQRKYLAFGLILGPALAFAISLHAQNACSSVLRSTNGAQIDIAPPGQFVDICAEDKDLCHLITAGYPSTTFTLAYLVLPAEWNAYEKNRGKPPHFSRYLIAQRAGALSPERLSGLKERLHSTQGEIPDHTQLPAVFASKGRVPLGITDESPDSISFGAVMRVGVTDNPSAGQITVASINSAIIIKNQLLSLYAFDSITDPSLVEPVKHLSRQWLSCLRRQN